MRLYRPFPALGHWEDVLRAIVKSLVMCKCRCGELGHASWATAEDLVMPEGPRAELNRTQKMWQFPRGPSAGFGYVLWATAQDFVMRYRLLHRGIVPNQFPLHRTTQQYFKSFPHPLMGVAQKWHVQYMNSTNQEAYTTKFQITGNTHTKIGVLQWPIAE